MSSPWLIIASSATASYLLRFMPFLLSRNIRPLPQTAIQVLESMSYAIIGGLVMESLLAGDELPARILFTVAAFAVAAWLKKPALVFYIFIILFGLSL